MSHSMIFEEIKQELVFDWRFRAADPAQSAIDNFAAEEGWMPARVPGTVYQDLLEAGRIPDPFLGMNEREVQWVAERDWCYRVDFHCHDNGMAYRDLVFEGLDTFARVWLNGEQILDSDNMFVPARVAVGRLLKPGRNRLAIYFDAALRRGREREALFGKRHLWNGDSSRLYVRKAQYHYGWDWGPVLLTAGPWKPVRLESYDLRIADVESQSWLNADAGEARIDVTTRLAGTTDVPGVTVTHRLFGPDGELVDSVSVAAQATVAASLKVCAPRLWWPAGHGEQPLYRLRTDVSADGRVIASSERRLGLRTLRLVQEPVASEPGKSFYFEINGKPLFVGGANWIPDDNLLNRITPERYRQRVQQAVDGNMLMLRVWAGGIYEDDAFYDACDELGVLVWQDFLFACGMYPAHPDFLASVEREVEAAVRRLRHRASLAIWCGNNEDYAIAESIGQYGSGKDMARFDARVIYEELLPRICARLDGQRPYWPGSPYSPSATGTLSSADQTIGDRHSWEIWHGAMLAYQDYRKVEARFVSEFGMQSHPSLPLLESVIPEAERFVQSRTVMAHNKAGSAEFPDGHRRLAVYSADTLCVGPTLGDHVYASQFVQAEAMRYAYQDFRRRWQKPGARAVGGALVWQLNDCWPATSWAIIDSAGVVKPAWHAIRRALAPIAVALRRSETGVRGWVMSDRAVASDLELSLAVCSLDGVCLHRAELALTAAPNASTDFEFALPPGAAPTAIQVEVRVGGQLLSTDTAWPEPFRFHRLAPAGLELERNREAGTVTLRSARPVKGLWLAAENLRFADNFIDLLPGRESVVAVRGDVSESIVLCALDQESRRV